MSSGTESWPDFLVAPLGRGKTQRGLFLYYKRKGLVRLTNWHNDDKDIKWYNWDLNPVSQGYLQISTPILDTGKLKLGGRGIENTVILNKQLLNITSNYSVK